MIRTIGYSQLYLSLILSTRIGAILKPPGSISIRQCCSAANLRSEASHLPCDQVGLRTMLFSTPFLIFSMMFSLMYIFMVRPRETNALQPLPDYPELAIRDSLFLVLLCYK